MGRAPFCYGGGGHAFGMSATAPFCPVFFFFRPASRPILQALLLEVPFLGSGLMDGRKSALSSADGRQMACAARRNALREAHEYLPQSTRVLCGEYFFALRTTPSRLLRRRRRESGRRFAVAGNKWPAIRRAVRYECKKFKCNVICSGRFPTVGNPL